MSNLNKTLYFEIRKKVEQRHLEIVDKYDREVGELHRTMKSLMGESDLLAEKLKNVEVIGEVFLINTFFKYNKIQCR